MNLDIILHISLHDLLPVFQALVILFYDQRVQPNKNMIQFDKPILNFLFWISLKETTKYFDIFSRNGRSSECYLFRRNVSLVFF